MPALSPPKLSDHSVLMIMFKWFDVPHTHAAAKADEQKRKAGNPKPVKFKVDEVKTNFMSDSKNVEALMRLVDELASLKSTRVDIDSWYDSFVKIYHDEMNDFYKKLEDTPRSRKNYYVAKNLGGAMNLAKWPRMLTRLRNCTSS